MNEETGIILPPGVRGIDPGPVKDEPVHILIDDRTDLPEGMVQTAVRDFFVENASLAWGHQSTFQTYANEGGSMLARTKFTVPKDIFEEIRLCRDIADRDDDVRETLGMMLAVAYEGGMQNFHEDERTVALFNEVAREMDLDHMLEEIYREYLIAQQVTTVTAWVRQRLSWTPIGTEGEQEERIATPMSGILHAEQIRTIDHDLFGNASLGFIPTDQRQIRWLEEFFGEGTTTARKAAMAREEPVAATLFTERVKVERTEFLTGVATYCYRLNPRMAQRFTAPRGMNPYPRPLMTANFALIEAKRLLNVMDYALLQGGANYIVVAKKGSEQFRATPEELANLGRVVANASRTGVVVGDHRLNFEIITPKLDELLNEKKRSLLGRKLAQLILRIPEPPLDAGAEAMKAWMEFMARVVANDRKKVQRHIEKAIYHETATRNRRVFPRGAAKIWHPKIVLQGTQFFTDMVLKLHDRGNISRKTATEIAGFSWEAEVAQRQAELDAGHDEIMLPASVPFNSPDNATPSDNDGGRPNGSTGGGGGQDPRAPQRQLRGPGETVRAWWDEEAQTTVRVGDVTYRLLEQYPDYEEGRLTQFERRAMESGEVATEGPVTVVPVNPGYEIDGHRVLRLASGLGVVLGYRKGDAAIVAKAFSFRSPEFNEVAAEELVVSLGYGRPSEDSE